MSTAISNTKRLNYIIREYNLGTYGSNKIDYHDERFWYTSIKEKQIELNKIDKVLFDISWL